MHDQVSNFQHWESLYKKALKSGWQDWHRFYDPIYVGRRGLDAKGWVRRVFQVPFLLAIFGKKPVETGMFDAAGKPIFWPRYKVIAHQALDMMLEQDPDSVLAFLDSQAPLWENGGDGLRPLQPEPEKQEAAK